MVEGELDATIADGLAWVCGGEFGGFLAAERTPDALHIHQLAVSFDRQRRGIGSALLLEAHRAARRHDLRSVTLTTFRDVAWNEPFYAGFGYRTLGDRDLGPRLRRMLANEVRNGMPCGRRCAMRLAL